MWKCPKCAENLEDDFDTCWHCGTGRTGEPSERPELFDPKRAEHLRRSRWTDSFGQIWMRCWIIACLMFLGAFIWSSDQPHSIRDHIQDASLLLTGGCGFVLFFSAVFFCEHKTLRRIGIIVGLIAMGLLALPFLFH